MIAGGSGGATVGGIAAEGLLVLSLILVSREVGGRGRSGGGASTAHLIVS